MKATVTYVGNVADTLDDGRPIAPGDRLEDIDLDLPHNKLLHDEGRLIVLEAKEEKLTGPALKERAAELEIEGRADMNADDLRAAIAKKEAEEAN